MGRSYWLVKSEPDAALASIPLVKQSRLSVMPTDKPAFERILKLGKTRLRRA